MNPVKVKVLIVDDSALMRQRLTRILSGDRRIEVIGIARNGKEGVQKALDLKPDVITMDIHMPLMDGITSLQYIMELAPCPVIILSSYSSRGATVTLEALELGAFDFVTKPDMYGPEEMDHLGDKLIERVLAAGHAAKTNGFKRGSRLHEECGRLQAETDEPELDYKKIVMIGASTGGPKTVMDILSRLPEKFPAPIFLVQHMPSLFTASFAERLNRSLRIRAVEAAHRMQVEPGTVYVAPGGHHMYVERALGQQHFRIALRQHPDDMLFKPSIDVSMHSLAEQVPGRKIVALLLTGIGSDGAQGMLHIREKGGVTIAESEETSIVYGMPRAALANGGARYVLPSYRIGEMLVSEVMGYGT